MSEFNDWCGKYRWYLLVIGIITFSLVVGIFLIIFAIMGFVNKRDIESNENISQAYETGLAQKFGKLKDCPVCNKKIELVDSNYLCSYCNSKLEFKKNDGISDYYKLIIPDDNYKSEYNRMVLPVYDWNLLTTQKIRGEEYLANEFTKKNYLILNITNLEELGVTINSKEKIYFFEENASVQEARAIRNYVGASARVTRGGSVHIGQAESHDELRNLDSGKFVITDKRIIFAGRLRNYSLPINKIIGVTEYSDGISVNSSNRQKAQTFIIRSSNLARIIINNFVSNED